MKERLGVCFLRADMIGFLDLCQKRKLCDGSEPCQTVELKTKDSEVD
jgi:hypothetical protein